MKLEFKLRGIIGYYPDRKLHPFFCTGNTSDNEFIFYFTNTDTDIEGWYRYRLKKL